MLHILPNCRPPFWSRPASFCRRYPGRSLSELPGPGHPASPPSWGRMLKEAQALPAWRPGRPSSRPGHRPSRIGLQQPGGQFAGLPGPQILIQKPPLQAMAAFIWRQEQTPGATPCSCRPGVPVLDKQQVHSDSRRKTRRMETASGSAHTASEPRSDGSEDLRSHGEGVIHAGILADVAAPAHLHHHGVGVDVDGGPGDAGKGKDQVNQGE